MKQGDDIVKWMIWGTLVVISIQLAQIATYLKHLAAALY